MVNQDYVNWLVSFIKNGTINKNTNLAFTVADIKITEYKDAVIATFKQKVVDGQITIEQYKQYTGIDYVA